MLIVAFSSARFSQTVSQRLRFGATVAVFLLVMAVLLQVVESQEAKTANRAPADEEFAVALTQPETPKPGEASRGPTYQEAEWTLLTGPSVDDHGYTFDSIDSTASVGSTAGAQSTVVGPLALNTASASGGGSMGGFGGGGPGAKPNAVTAGQEVPIPVPETSSSAILLVIALLTILCLGWLNKRRRAGTSRSR